MLNFFKLYKLYVFAALIPFALFIYFKVFTEPKNIIKGQKEKIEELESSLTLQVENSKVDVSTALNRADANKTKEAIKEIEDEIKNIDDDATTGSFDWVFFMQN